MWFQQNHGNTTLRGQPLYNSKIVPKYVVAGPKVFAIWKFQCIPYGANF